MKTKLELSNIDGYPDILPHIIDVSEVIDFRIKDSISCGFTVVLDDFSCLNVFHEGAEGQKQELVKDIQRFRDLLVSEVNLINPGFVPYNMQERAALQGRDL